MPGFTSGFARDKVCGPLVCNSLPWTIFISTLCSNEFSLKESDSTVDISLGFRVSRDRGKKLAN